MGVLKARRKKLFVNLTYGSIMLPNFVQLKELSIITYDICRIRKGPQDLRHSLNLVGLLFLLNFVLPSFSFYFLYKGLVGIGVAILFTIFPLALTYLVLSLTKKSTRFLQTIAALLATNLFIEIIALAIILVGATLAAISPHFMGLVLQLSMIGLLVWQIYIQANIFKQALSQSLLVGMAASLVILFANSLVFSWINNILGQPLPISGG